MRIPLLHRAFGTLLVAVLSLACATKNEPPPVKNVLVIVVDTLGASHIGCYGGATRTPNIDALAASGVRFERAFSTAPWTKPAIASLFTGVMPSRHGVRRMRDALPEEVLTLAELAGRAGMRTAAVVSHFLITPEHGYGQGFEHFEARPIAGPPETSSKRVTQAAISALDAVEDGPFFLFVHYFDPHSSYFHHARYPHTDDYVGPVESGMEIWDLRDMRAELGESDVGHLTGLYREEIAFTDHHIGVLFEALQRMGLADDTLIVLTADHGEELMEHGWIGHTRTLYDELLRVPLIVSAPGRVPPAVFTAPVSLLDVAPTIAQLAGLPRSPQWEGRSLAVALWGGRSLSNERPLFAEVTYGRPPGEAVRNDPRAAQKVAHKTAVMLDDFKLIHDEISDTYELYDRRADGSEQNNLWRDQLRGDHPLVRRLAAWEDLRATGMDEAVLEFDEKELEQLRQLGYVR